MTVTPLVVIGAGGFGREALDVVEAINRVAPTFEILGVIDDAPSEDNLRLLEERQTVYLGDLATWLDTAHRATYLIAIGAPASRQRVFEKVDALGLLAATVVHPSASVGSRVQIAEGAVICGGVQLSTNVTIGRHVHVNPNATVGHDSRLQDFVSINPAATISGNVVIGEGALVGAGAVVLAGLSVGARSVVGASACVVRDVAEGQTVKGVPAR